MSSYDNAYDAWDEMTPSERKSWCKRNDVWCTDEEANQTADWLSEIDIVLDYNKRIIITIIKRIWKQSFYVAVAIGTIFNPTIVEKFNDLADAREYAALMCRIKKKNYIVLVQESEWNGAQENA